MSLGTLRSWTGRRGHSEAQPVRTAQEPPVIRLSKHGELGRANVAAGQSRLSWVSPQVRAFSIWFAQLGLSRPWPGERRGLGPVMESGMHLRRPCGSSGYPHSVHCQA